MPALAAAYLLRCGFKDVKTKLQIFDRKKMLGFQDNGGFSDGALIVANDPILGQSVIHVAYDSEKCSFVKQN